MDDTCRSTISYRTMMDCLRPAATRIPAPDQDPSQTAGQVSGRKPTANIGAKTTSTSGQPRDHQPIRPGGWRLSTSEDREAAASCHGGTRLRHLGKPVTSASVTTYTTSAKYKREPAGRSAVRTQGQTRQLCSQQRMRLGSRDAVSSCARLMPQRYRIVEPACRRADDRPSRGHLMPAKDRATRRTIGIQGDD
jgi:hypothetical protein